MAMRLDGRLTAEGRWATGHCEEDGMAHAFASIRSTRGTVPLDLLGGPAERYGLIYMDPPWEFENYSEKGEDRNPNRWYDTMTLEEMKLLPVADLAADDSMCACWMTFPRLLDGLELLRHYGFRYVTVGNVWIKLNKLVGLRSVIDIAKDIFMGPGYWTRANAEILVLASKGSPKRLSKGVRQVVLAPRGAHSEKPLVFRRNLEALVDTDRRIEIFCRREPEKGWDVWGNQVGAIEAGTIVKRHLSNDAAPAPLLEYAA
jgi:N6-adenosine-specific RNA methylase IME4